MESLTKLELSKIIGTPQELKALGFNLSPEDLITLNKAAWLVDELIN
ncbi:hypothetical protein GW796_08690 [archaeon]|nr:hypothetical protein [archaeon]